MTSSVTIEVFKQKLRDSDPSTISTASDPFPLASYLQLIESAGSIAFLDYCKGARVLHYWLTNNGIVPLKLPAIEAFNTSSYHIPRLAAGYLTQEIAKIIAGPVKSYLDLDIWLAHINCITISIHYIHTIEGSRKLCPL